MFKQPYRMNKNETGGIMGKSVPGRGNSMQENVKELESPGNLKDKGRILHLCGAMVEEDPGRERRG